MFFLLEIGSEFLSIMSFASQIHSISLFQDRATNPEERFSASTTLTVNVIDSDDQPPKFVHDSYSSKVSDSSRM